LKGEADLKGLKAFGKCGVGWIGHAVTISHQDFLRRLE
jgi:hypothetical protein